MRIAIAGPGALGCLLASLLASSRGHETDDSLYLLDHNRERAALLNSQGIILDAPDRQQLNRIPASSEPRSIGPVDTLLFCVKAPDLRGCIQSCLPLITDQTLLVFLQNGIGHLDILDRMTLPVFPGFACSSEGATLIGPGHVRHAGRGITHLGFLQNPPAQQQLQLKELAEILRMAGLEVALTTDIRTRLWAKLLINAGINPLTALYNRTNGQLLTSCAARGRLKNIIREAETVARACGITIEHDPVDAATSVCKKTAKNISSMLQDRRNQRPTEIDAINGAIIREGKRAGIPTPFNNEVVRQIRDMENEYSEEKARAEKI